MISRHFYKITDWTRYNITTDVSECYGWLELHSMLRVTIYVGRISVCIEFRFCVCPGEILTFLVFVPMPMAFTNDQLFH